MSKKKVGVIVVPPGAIVDKHEKLAVDFIAVERGVDITFLVPDRRKGQKTPDIEMSGRQWEIKSPKGKSSRTVENNIRQALRQSPYIIIDLRRMDGRVPTRKYVAEAERQFTLTRSIKHLIVVTREEEVLDFTR